MRSAGRPLRELQAGECAGSSAAERVRSALAASGTLVLRDALDHRWVARLKDAADRLYTWVQELSAREGPLAVERRLPSRSRFAFTASSLTLAALDEEAGHDVERALVTSEPLHGFLSALHGGAFAVDLDQAWLRRQYAPSRYPLGHAPHSWHQDGALGHDFGAPAEEPSGLLPLVTCWVPLTPAGADAPGLEILATRLEELLAPDELTEAAVSRRFGDEGSWTPRLSPGDVLLFGGDTLHRTHVTAAMTEDRTSVELRTFRAGFVPPRLAGDRFRSSAGDEEPAPLLREPEP